MPPVVTAPQLSVNVNAIAQLRNRRDLPWPGVTAMCRIALDNGAHGITVHPRPDERHIRRTDVDEIAAMLRNDYPGKEFNIEGYPSPDFLALVEKARPDQVTLVPDDPGQSTSDHGWDTVAQADFLRSVISRLKSANMRVSVFIDADPAAARGAASLGTDRIELYTGPYGHTFVAHRKAEQLDALVRAADAARAEGLGINVGHDLTLDNLPPLLARIPGVAEASIGHALTADALIYGMAETVRRYCAVLAARNR